MIFPSPFDLAALAALAQASARVAEATRGLLPALPGATAKQRAAVVSLVSRTPNPSRFALGYELDDADMAAWEASFWALRFAVGREVAPRPEWMDTVVGLEAGAFGTGPEPVLMFEVYQQALLACWVAQHGGDNDVYFPVAQFVRAADYALSHAGCAV